MDEALATCRFSDPPVYVQETPKLFNAWHRWSYTYQEDAMKIRPLGQKIGPGWMRSEFERLEDFYQYYLELINAEVL